MSALTRGIVVLGMHRSGTSCLGGLLHALGAYFGAADMDLGANAENPKGFWERKDFNWVCEFALLSQDCCWWLPPDNAQIAAPAAALLETSFAALRAELDAHAPWFVKDPRLCLLLPALRARLDDAVFVHVVRAPVAAALSLARRNGLAPAHALALWEVYTAAAFAATRGGLRYIVDYDALLGDPEGVLGGLLRFLGDAGIAGLRTLDASQRDYWVDSSLRRERAAAGAAGFLNAVQQDLFNAIERRTILSETAARELSPGARAEFAHLRRLRQNAAGSAPLSDQTALAQMLLQSRLEVSEAVAEKRLVTPAAGG